MDCKRILIADDEEDITWAISRCLTNSDLDISVDCVSNGNDAFELLQQNEYDLLVSDIRMPGRDGMQLTLDAHQINPSTRVIIMTAYGSQEVMNRASVLGSFFYLEKPFDISYLKQLIKAAFELQENGGNGVISDARTRELIGLHCVG